MIYAHFDHDTNKFQTLDEHLKNVSIDMEKGLETVSFSELHTCTDLLKLTGLFHDLGKMTTWFQKYILSDRLNYDPRKNHSLISAALLNSRKYDNSEEMYLSVLAIACHHKNLSSDQPDPCSYDYLEDQFDNCILHKDDCYTGSLIEDNGFSTNDFMKFWRKTRRVIKKKHSPNYFATLQFLFAKLISADKRDSSGMINKSIGCLAGDVETYIKAKSANISTAVDNDRNMIRNSVLNQIHNFTDLDLLNQRIYTLTAPTGTGKTLTSISAALELAKRLEKIYNTPFHIISAIPFLNILEQTAIDYQNIFGDIIIDSSSVSVTKDDLRDDISLEQRMMLINTWMSPVVLTTFVQFFESYITGNNKKMMKLSRLSNAIVIMDEIQALDAEHYPLYATVLDLMGKCYGTRFILMTATQPKIFDCAKYLGYKPSPTIELLENYKYYFNKLNRTKLVDMSSEITDFYKLIDYIKLESLDERKILIVVNTIKDSIDLYNIVCSAGFSCLYLSTNLTRNDRKKVIQEAKERLDESYVMVSTQTIEAGVDLDFDIAFRDLAPMESIIQTAGRVNRSGGKDNHQPVYIINTGSAKKIYFYMAIEKTAKSIKNLEIYEKDYQKLIENYYDSLIENQGIGFDNRIYEDGILQLDYNIINEFKMIKFGDRSSIIFIQNQDVEQLIVELCRTIIAKDMGFEKKIILQSLFNRLGEYTVEVFKNKIENNLPISFFVYSKELCGVGIDLNYLVVPYDDLQRYYCETGFKIDGPDVFIF